MTMITPSYLGETIEYSSLHACRSTLEDPTALRKRHAAFGRGSLTLLRPENPRILAFVREHESEVLLVVANLSRFVQFVELDLTPWRGTVPVELFGGSSLPAVGDEPYPLTLAGHGFYWFSLSPKARDEARADAYEPPVLDLGPWPALVAADHGAPFADVLARWTSAQAWFAGRRRRVDAAHLVDVVPVGDGPNPHLVVLELAYEEGGSERYLLAPAFADGARAVEIHARSPQAVLATTAAPQGLLFDALADAITARALLEALFVQRRAQGRAGVITAEGTVEVRAEHPPSQPSAAPPGATVLFGERFFVEVSRRLDDGPSPGLALERFLASRGATAPVPALAGAVEYAAPRSEPVALAVLRGFVPSESDGFVHTVAEAHRFFERALARGPDEPAPRTAPWDVHRLTAAEPPALVRDTVGAFLDTARLLGRRTAELHRALAAVPAGSSTSQFSPEPYSPLDQRAAYQSMRNLAGRCMRELQIRSRFLPPEVAPLAARVVGRHDEAMRTFGALLGRRLTSPRTRHLGGLDLRRVLLTGSDLVFADLEGDRTRPVAERKRKGSPLRDVAGLVRSLYEATFSTLLDPVRVRPEDVDAARPWAHAFWEGATSVLLRAYLEEAGERRLLPRAPGELDVLLSAFVLESAFGALADALGAPASPTRQAVALGLCAALLEG